MANNNYMALMMSFYSSGIVIDRKENDSIPNIVYISVPEKSYKLDDNGYELSGKILARQFKEMYQYICPDSYIVKFKIRSGDYWTKEKSDVARKSITRELVSELFGESFGGIF